VTDILATTYEKRNRHLERIVTYCDKRYHGNVTDVTDNEGTITDRDKHSTETKFIAFFRLMILGKKILPKNQIKIDYLIKNRLR
jgi:hypothetical protein